MPKKGFIYNLAKLGIMLCGMKKDLNREGRYYGAKILPGAPSKSRFDHFVGF
jgi:hypothetical protein